MTKEQILAMPAGREMDDLIASKVMEWTFTGPLFRDGTGKLWNVGGKEIYRTPHGFFLPSTDNATALEVANHWHGDFEIRRLNGQFRVTFINPGKQSSLIPRWLTNEYVIESAETLPLAICRAALLSTL
jgi:hypothetical protein